MLQDAEYVHHRHPPLDKRRLNTGNRLLNGEAFHRYPHSHVKATTFPPGRSKHQKRKEENVRRHRGGREAKGKSIEWAEGAVGQKSAPSIPGSRLGLGENIIAKRGWRAPVLSDPRPNILASTPSSSPSPTCDSRPTRDWRATQCCQGPLGRTQRAERSAHNRKRKNKERVSSTEGAGGHVRSHRRVHHGGGTVTSDFCIRWQSRRAGVLVHPQQQGCMCCCARVCALPLLKGSEKGGEGKKGGNTTLATKWTGAYAKTRSTNAVTGRPRPACGDIRQDRIPRSR